MARKKSGFFTDFDSPYMTQPPKGSAETNIEYGGVEDVGSNFNDPLGVLPTEATPRNIGPKGGEKGE